jgi:hypothetical protein
LYLIILSKNSTYSTFFFKFRKKKSLARNGAQANVLIHATLRAGKKRTKKSMDSIKFYVEDKTNLKYALINVFNKINQNLYA